MASVISTFAPLSANSCHGTKGKRYARRALLRELRKISPVYDDYMIVMQRLSEFGTGDDVVIALAPRGAVRLVVYRHRLELGVVVTEVHDDLGESRLEAGDGVEIKLL